MRLRWGLRRVAEPPKLYGPHVLIIVFQTSDNRTWEPDNCGSLSGVLGEPRIIHVYLSEHDTLQRYCSITIVYTNILHRNKQRKSYKPQVYKSFIKLLQILNLANLAVGQHDKYHSNSTQEGFTLPKGAQQTSLLLVVLLQQGLTNPEYKGTQQDLIDEKERLQGHAGLRGIKVSLQQEPRLTFVEKLTKD